MTWPQRTPRSPAIKEPLSIPLLAVSQVNFQPLLDSSHCKSYFDYSVEFDLVGIGTKADVDLTEKPKYIHLHTEDKMQNSQSVWNIQAVQKNRKKTVVGRLLLCLSLSYRAVYYYCNRQGNLREADTEILLLT